MQAISVHCFAKFVFLDVMLAVSRWHLELVLGSVIRSPSNLYLLLRTVLGESGKYFEHVNISVSVSCS